MSNLLQTLFEMKSTENKLSTRAPPSKIQLVEERLFHLLDAGLDSAAAEKSLGFQSSDASRLAQKNNRHQYIDTLKREFADRN